jgi:hypothetical protein
MLVGGRRGGRFRTFPERFGEATIRRRDCQPWAEEIHHAICEAYQPEEI